MSAGPADPPAKAADDENRLEKGASIGRHVVLGLLGRGGMGEVYAAYDPDLDRKIAVKLLRARTGDQSAADGRTRLLREAQAIARLSHPNVVVVYDVGTFRDSVFIAMEFVEGSTLGYWLQAAPRGWREVLDVYSAAGRGLVAAHEAGLVHRDFKPENVMLTKAGQVRVMDFGLARQGEEGAAADGGAAPRVLDPQAAAALASAADAGFDPEATTELGNGVGGASARVATTSGGYLSVKLTQTGAILGTPAYMAPEQFAGGYGDARADQFSFCVALYEGLYGHRPFAGDTAAKLMTSVMSGRIRDAPSDTRVPTWIRRVLLRGLSTEAAARFPSMTDLLAALARDPAGRRRRWLVAAAGVALTAAIGFGGHRISAAQRALCAAGPIRAATAWDPVRRRAVQRAFSATGSKHAAQAFAGAAAAIDRYVERWTGAYREACEATQMRGEQSAEVLDLRMSCLGERLAGVRALADVLASADGSVIDNAVTAAGALPTLDRCADVQMLRAVIKPPDDLASRQKVDRLREEVARVSALASAGLCDRAKEAAAPVQRDAKQLAYRPLEAEIDYALGRLFDTCLDPKDAIVDLEDAIMAAEESRHDEIAIYASAALGAAYADRAHDVARGRQWIRHSEAILARFPGHPALEAWVAVSSAVVMLGEGRLEEAVKENQRILAIRESLLGTLDTDVGISFLNLAVALHEVGRDEEAATNIRRAVEIFAKIHGDDSGRVALASLDEGEILTALGKFEAADAALRRAETIWKQQGASPFFLGYGLFYRGRLLLAEKNPRAAAATLEKSLEMLGTEDRRATAEAQFLLARALASAPEGRERAVNLAQQSHEVLAADPSARRVVSQIESWLREYATP
jgi:serine/threonine protein kinase/tetratricopeptide (TPR) repeat protein